MRYSIGMESDNHMEEKNIPHCHLKTQFQILYNDILGHSKEVSFFLFHVLVFLFHRYFTSISVHFSFKRVTFQMLQNSTHSPVARCIVKFQKKFNNSAKWNMLSLVFHHMVEKLYIIFLHHPFLRFLPLSGSKPNGCRLRRGTLRCKQQEDCHLHDNSYGSLHVLLSLDFKALYFCVSSGKTLLNSLIRADLNFCWGETDSEFSAVIYSCMLAYTAKPTKLRMTHTQTSFLSLLMPC